MNTPPELTDLDLFVTRYALMRWVEYWDDVEAESGDVAPLLPPARKALEQLSKVLRWQSHHSPREPMLLPLTISKSSW